MAIDSVAQSGVQGINVALAQAQSAANTLASPNLDQTIEQVTESVVELKQAEQQAQASARVVRASDETLGTLLDVIA